MKQKLLKILQKFLAKRTKSYLKKTQPTVIGITGSVGKTTCRKIVTATLREFFPDKKIYTSAKNFNSELGLVFSVFQIEHYTPSILGLLGATFEVCIKSLSSKKFYDILILEYGIDAPGDMDFLVGIVQPDYSIITKIDYVHASQFASGNEIAKEKFKLASFTNKKTYLNTQDAYCKKSAQELAIPFTLFHEGDLQLEQYEFYKTGEKIQSRFSIAGHTIKTNMLGEENAMYFGLALSLLQDLGISKTSLPQEIYISVQNELGRFEILDGVEKNILIDSSYNASPKSMEMMIKNTFQLAKLFPDYGVGFVLGDMRELGVYSAESHEKVIPLLEKSDFVLTVGSEMQKYVAPELGQENAFLSSVEAGITLKNFLVNTKKKYVILFKGSQNTIFTEEALKQVLENTEDETRLVRQGRYWLGKKGI